ncbi:MAG: GTPase [Candidatus Woesearchaeota archaeon]
MNFQDLHSVNDSKFYLDQAFKKSKLHGEHIFARSSGEQLPRIIKTECEKLKVFTKVLKEYMDDIVKKFPNIDNLPEIYTELIRLTLDYDYLKKSLGSLTWTTKRFDELSLKYLVYLRKCETKSDVNKIMGAYYGRIGSVMRQVDKSLKYIEEARKIMKNYPTLKTDLFTVAITGFPNIGKSTLLSKLTPAKPEIQNYAFTTKQINQGYAMYGQRKVQFVDTPGVLDRSKMNNIELQAFLVLKYLVHLVIYIIDLTEPYPIKQQEELLGKLKEQDKPIIIYLSKADIIDEKSIAKARRKYKAISTLEELNKKIEKAMKEHYFD